MYADSFEIRSVSHLFLQPRTEEPPHVHIDRDNLSAKFWLNPVSLGRNRGFSARELRQVERIVRENRQQLLEAWNEYFGIEN